ncbi:hypothetical protein H6G06_15010 [Anabaena sphaerica FACHB-251]|uniref:Uncharacterized protein n=1 Tax=Anabaena sphaerica FACHB-251 TaxID=2692883 RepID=A0A927A216_9NOST|nr:hypothetical protein [Anabaena sphaerica]MBD2294756.1 hypothetical protein [Anabaena sphaerica FACHB-251]
MEHLNDTVFSLLGNLHFHISFPVSDHTHLFLVGDYTNVKDADLLGQIQRNWNNFVKTGQIWALFIGMIIGYMLKGLTSYG